jgi:hypothetical protein
MISPLTNNNCVVGTATGSQVHLAKDVWLRETHAITPIRSRPNHLGFPIKEPPTPFYKIDPACQI